MAFEGAQKEQRGFTLVEVLMAVAVMGVLAGFASMNFNKYIAHLSLKDAANDLYQLVLFAQEKSVVDRSPVKIEFNYSGRYYRLMELAAVPPNRREREDRVFKAASGRFGRETVFPENIDYSGSRPEILCFPDGICRAGSWLLRQPNGGLYELSISESPSSITLNKVPF